jgi:hypothetical protein
VLTDDELVERLRAADTAWSTVQGTTRHWRQQDLVEAAFHQQFAHPERRASWTMTSVSTVDDDGEDAIIEEVLAVAFDTRGQRRRAETVSRHQEEWLADLVVVDGPTFWARTADTVQTNNGDTHQSHGGADIINLLLPSSVLDGYDLTLLDEQEQIAGRTCAVAVAIPRPPDPYGRTPGSEVFDMIAGGTEFRLSVDVDKGVLLRVTKLVDDTEAEICEFLAITFDESLDDNLFAPLSS